MESGFHMDTVTDVFLSLGLGYLAEDSCVVNTVFIPQFCVLRVLGTLLVSLECSLKGERRKYSDTLGLLQEQ